MADNDTKDGLTLPLELPDEHADVLEDPPDFTDKQRRYLEAVFHLPCCHTTGTHPPKHFIDGDSHCRIQTWEAFKRGVKELGLDPPVASDPSCGWCHDTYEGEGDPIRSFRADYEFETE